MIQSKIQLDKNDFSTQNRDKCNFLSLINLDYCYYFHLVKLPGEKTNVRIFTKQIKNIQKEANREKKKRFVRKEFEKSQMKSNQKIIFNLKSESKMMDKYRENSLGGPEFHEKMKNSKVEGLQLNDIPMSETKYIYTSKKEFEQNYQISFNNIRNSEIKKVGMNFVAFLEKNLFCKIREIKLKFVYDYQDVLYFIGFKSMLVKLRTGILFF